MANSPQTLEHLTHSLTRLTQTSATAGKAGAKAGAGPGRQGQGQGQDGRGRTAGQTAGEGKNKPKSLLSISRRLEQRELKRLRSRDYLGS
jgi:hypothetical protein